MPQRARDLDQALGALRGVHGGALDARTVGDVLRALASITAPGEAWTIRDLERLADTIDPDSAPGASGASGLFQWMPAPKPDPADVDTFMAAYYSPELMGPGE